MKDIKKVLRKNLPLSRQIENHQKIIEKLDSIEHMLAQLENREASHHQKIIENFRSIRHVISSTKVIVPAFPLLTDRFMKMIPVTIGLSATKKYIVEDKNGSKYFLKIEPSENYSSVEKFFLMLEKLYFAGVPMPRPIEYGKCEEGAYILSSFIGRNSKNSFIATTLEIEMPTLTDEKKYLLGLRAGRALRRIHQVSFLRNKDTCREWNWRFPKWAKDLVEFYVKSPNKFDGYEYYLETLQEPLDWITQRPSCLLHHDYGSHNLLWEKEELWVIDFGSTEAKDGDPYYDFRNIFISGLRFPHFSTGTIHGYFDGIVPQDFFKLTKFYAAWSIMDSLHHAKNSKRVESITKSAKNFLLSYDNMKAEQPSWYFEQIDIQGLEGKV